jgi:hypothetical protein
LCSSSKEHVHGYGPAPCAASKSNYNDRARCATTMPLLQLNLGQHDQSLKQIRFAAIKCNSHLPTNSCISQPKRQLAPSTLSYRVEVYIMHPTDICFSLDMHLTATPADDRSYLVVHSGGVHHVPD